MSDELLLTPGQYDLLTVDKPEKRRRSPLAAQVLQVETRRPLPRGVVCEHATQRPVHFRRQPREGGDHLGGEILRTPIGRTWRPCPGGLQRSVPWTRPAGPATLRRNVRSSGKTNPTHLEFGTDLSQRY